MRVEELARQILEHKRRYYSGHAVIPDEAYDELERELRDREPEHPVLEFVGTDFLNDQSTKVSHEPPMLSLAKTYKPTELLLFIQKHKTVCISDKLDGMALSLEYDRQGRLFRASTRGNGRLGENVLSHLLMIPNVPKKLPSYSYGKNIATVEVRGEVFFPLSRFEDFRQRFDSFRNAVPGTFGRKDPEQASDVLKEFQFCAYDCVMKVNQSPLRLVEACRALGLSGNSHFEKLQVIESWGFWTGVKQQRTFLIQADALPNESFDQTVHEWFNAERDFAIDGLVARCDDDATWEELGTTAHHPRGSLAFKQASETTVTTIEDIIVGVGRSGKISFRAKLTPVSLSGATISFASLHNAEFIEKGGYSPGAKVKLKRSGEVIPYIIGLEESSQQPYELPTHCLCGSPLTRQGPDLACLNNPSCPYKDSEATLYFVKSLEVYGVSEKLLERFRAAGLLQRPSDLFQIREEDILELEGFGEKSAKNIVTSIQSRRVLPLEVFLTALGLKRGGQVKCQEVAREFQSLRRIRDMTPEELMELKGWAYKSAKDFIDSLNEKSSMIDELLKWITVEEPSVTQNITDSKLSGRKFCITGSLQEPRSSCEQKIEAHGGQVVSNVTSKTDYLVCNQASSSSKYKKAFQLDIPIITEKELEKMLKGLK